MLDYGMPTIVKSAQAVAKVRHSPTRPYAQEVLDALASGEPRRIVNAQLIYGAKMLFICAEDSHEFVVEPRARQASILSSSVSATQLGREIGELAALWARMETQWWRAKSAEWNEAFPDRPIDLDDSPWDDNRRASRGGGVDAC